MDCLTDRITDFLAFFPTILAIDAARYAIAAGALVLVLRLAPAAWRTARRLQSRLASRADRNREIGYSLLTIVIFALNGYGVHLGARHGLFMIIPGLPTADLVQAVATLALMVVTHDAYFYWTHRAMHHRWLFRFFHRTHHRSHTPTPWAAYAFDWPEAAVQAVFLPLFLLLVPVHGIVLFVFMTHMILRNVMGHAGVELFPRGWVGSRWLSWINATVHHDLHHATARWNYGLYFRWWDRIMGTEHPDYVQAFDRATGETRRTMAARDATLVEKA